LTILEGIGKGIVSMMPSLVLVITFSLMMVSECIRQIIQLPRDSTVNVEDNESRTSSKVPGD
jgi:hypothetical protein